MQLIFLREIGAENSFPLPFLIEDEIEDLIDEGMLNLADRLTELKAIPEAETLAKLLLEPSESMSKYKSQLLILTI